ncbi:MAG: N-acetylmuramoyl-L-alanine amidase [Acidimicrobiia bacterium]
MRSHSWMSRSAVAGLLGTVVGFGLTVAPAVDPAGSTPATSITAQSLSGDGTVHAGWSRPVTGTANLVGVRWNGDPSARFAIESKAAGGRWHRIAEVGYDADHRPDPGTLEAQRAAVSASRPATEPVWVGDAASVRVRLVHATARDVVAERVQSPRAVAPSATAGATGVAMPGIISRAEWGADESLRLSNCPEPPDISTNVTIAVVHHTGGNNNYGPGDTPAIVRGLYGYATQTLHYCDTHYNFFVDRYGQIFEGRAGSVWDPVRAAHTTGMNTGSVGVALIGNFETSPVPAVAVDALERLLAWKLNWHGVDPTRTVDYTTISGTDRWPAGSTHTLPYIVGHRDPGQTDCPGQYLYDLLPAIRLDVARRILTGGADNVLAHTAGASLPKVVVMSRYGVVYPAGGAPEYRSGATWPGWTIARDIELNSAGLGGYTLDGLGGLHPFGYATAASGGPYFPGLDVARDLVLRTASSGWVLDAYGGIHPFGGAPALGIGPYFPGFDVARKLVHFSSGWYVLDAYGALHSVGGAKRVNGPYWPGWAIARDVRPNPGGPGGYLLDGFGGVTPVGGAPPLTGIPYFGRDRAVGLVVLSGGRGYTVRDDGSLARFGGAPRLSQGRATWANAQPITSPWVVAAVSGVG